MISAIFVNMPIVNLKRTVEFFTGLGFTFNSQFTSETSTCMIIGENIYAMLVEHEQFKGFIDKPIAERTSTEMLLSLSCESADAVRRLAETAFSFGARWVNDPDDKGFMFSWAFEDLDGHLWDLFWMDPSHIQNS